MQSLAVIYHLAIMEAPAIMQTLLFSHFLYTMQGVHHTELVYNTYSSPGNLAGLRTRAVPGFYASHADNANPDLQVLYT
jgi:hypothetical protein